jgi:hypothetical protein
MRKRIPSDGGEVLFRRGESGEGSGRGEKVLLCWMDVLKR